MTIYAVPPSVGAHPPRLHERYRVRKWLRYLQVINERGEPVRDERGKRVRKGGWKKTPRSGERWSEGLKKLIKWRGPYYASQWWRTLNDERTRDPTSYEGRQFRRDFRLPRALFDQLLAELQTVPSLRDKPEGAGHGQGPLCTLRPLRVPVKYELVSVQAVGKIIREPSPLTKCAVRSFGHEQMSDDRRHRISMARVSQGGPSHTVYFLIG